MKTWKLVSTTLLSTFVIFGLGTATGHTIEKNRVAEKVAAAKGETNAYPHEQTWPKSYRETTCADWLDDMTPDERYVTSTDLLGGFSWSASSQVYPAAAKDFINEVDAKCGEEISRNVVRAAWDVYQEQPGAFT